MVISSFRNLNGSNIHQQVKNGIITVRLGIRMIRGQSELTGSSFFSVNAACLPSMLWRAFVTCGSKSESKSLDLRRGDSCAQCADQSWSSSAFHWWSLHCERRNHLALNLCRMQLQPFFPDVGDFSASNPGGEMWSPFSARR